VLKDLQLGEASNEIAQSVGNWLKKLIR